MSEELKKKVKIKLAKLKLLFGESELDVDYERKAYKKVAVKMQDFASFCDIVQEIQEADEESFENYSELEKMVFNSKMKIGKFAFAACKNLKEIKILEQSGEKKTVTDWNEEITKDVQLEDGCFGGCVNLDIKNLPANVGPFYRFHFVGDFVKRGCYAEVNGSNQRIKIDNLKYTTIPASKQEEIAFYFYLFTTLSLNVPDGMLMFLCLQRPFPEMDIEIVYDKENGNTVSPEIVLRNIWNEEWDKNGIPCFTEVKKIKNSINKLFDKFEADCKDEKLKDDVGVVEKDERQFPIIPPFVTQIGSGAYDKWFSLNELRIPNHINKIEKDAFTGCKSLKKVYVPKNGTTIEEGAFSDDTEVVLY